MSSDPFSNEAFDRAQQLPEPRPDPFETLPSPAVRGEGPAPQVDRTLGEDFQTGVNIGSAQVVGGFQALGAIAANAMDMPRMAAGFEQSMRQTYQDAADNKISVSKLEEIGGTGDFFHWASGTLGQLAPSMGLSLAGGGIGGIIGRKLVKDGLRTALMAEATEQLVKSGVSRNAARNAVKAALTDPTTHARMIRASRIGTGVGAFGGSAPPQVGGIFSDLRARGVEADDAGRTALIGGAAGGALDALPVIVALDRFFPGVDKQLAKSFVRQVGGAMGMQAIVEGGTEGLQEVIAIAATAYEDPSFNVSDPANKSRVLNAMAAGALGGVVMGGVSGAGGASIERVQRAVDNTRDGMIKRRAEFDKRIDDAWQATPQSVKDGLADTFAAVRSAIVPAKAADGTPDTGVDPETGETQTQQQTRIVDELEAQAKAIFEEEVDPVLNSIVRRAKNIGRRLGIIDSSVGAKRVGFMTILLNDIDAMVSKDVAPALQAAKERLATIAAEAAERAKGLPPEAAQEEIASAAKQIRAEAARLAVSLKEFMQQAEAKVTSDQNAASAAGMDVAEDGVDADPEPDTTASVPVMITQQMRKDLASFGYNPEAVAKMTPKQAWAAIQEGEATAQKLGEEWRQTKDNMQRREAEPDEAAEPTDEAFDDPFAAATEAGDVEALRTTMREVNGRIRQLRAVPIKERTPEQQRELEQLTEARGRAVTAGRALVAAAAPAPEPPPAPAAPAPTATEELGGRMRERFFAGVPENQAGVDALTKGDATAALARVRERFVGMRRRIRELQAKQKRTPEEARQLEALLQLRTDATTIGEALAIKAGDVKAPPAAPAVPASGPVQFGIQATTTLEEAMVVAGLKPLLRQAVHAVRTAIAEKTAPLTEQLDKLIDEASVERTDLAPAVRKAEWAKVQAIRRRLNDAIAKDLPKIIAEVKSLNEADPKNAVRLRELRAKLDKIILRKSRLELLIEHAFKVRPSQERLNSLQPRLRELTRELRQVLSNEVTEDIAGLRQVIETVVAGRQVTPQRVAQLEKRIASLRAQVAEVIDDQKYVAAAAAAIKEMGAEQEFKALFNESSLRRAVARAATITETTSGELAFAPGEELELNPEEMIDDEGNYVDVRDLPGLVDVESGVTAAAPKNRLRVRLIGRKTKERPNNEQIKISEVDPISGRAESTVIGEKPIPWKANEDGSPKDAIKEAIARLEAAELSRSQALGWSTPMVQYRAVPVEGGHVIAAVPIDDASMIFSKDEDGDIPVTEYIGRIMTESRKRAASIPPGDPSFARVITVVSPDGTRTRFDLPTLVRLGIAIESREGLLRSDKLFDQKRAAFSTVIDILYGPDGKNVVEGITTAEEKQTTIVYDRGKQFGNERFITIAQLEKLTPKWASEHAEPSLAIAFAVSARYRALRALGVAEAKDGTTFDVLKNKDDQAFLTDAEFRQIEEVLGAKIPKWLRRKKAKFTKDRIQGTVDLANTKIDAARSIGDLRKGVVSTERQQDSSPYEVVHGADGFSAFSEATTGDNTFDDNAMPIEDASRLLNKLQNQVPGSKFWLVRTENGGYMVAEQIGEGNNTTPVFDTEQGVVDREGRNVDASYWESEADTVDTRGFDEEGAQNESSTNPYKNQGATVGTTGPTEASSRIEAAVRSAPVGKRGREALTIAVVMKGKRATELVTAFIGKAAKAMGLGYHFTVTDNPKSIPQLAEVATKDLPPARVFMDGDEVAIFLNPAKLPLGMKNDAEVGAVMTAVAHEVGHVVFWAYFANLAPHIQAEMLRAWARQNPGAATVYNPEQVAEVLNLEVVLLGNGLRSFEEWMADQFVAYARDDSNILGMQETAEPALRGWFARVVSKLKQLWEMATQDLKLTEEFNDFAEGIRSSLYEGRGQTRYTGAMWETSGLPFLPNLERDLGGVNPHDQVGVVTRLKTLMRAFKSGQSSMIRDTLATTGEAIFFSLNARIRTLSDTYSALNPLRAAFKPPAGEQGFSLRTRIHAESSRFFTAINGIINGLSDRELDTLRTEMESGQRTSPAAVALAKLFVEMRQYGLQAGMPVRDVLNYWPRSIDRQKIVDNPQVYKDRLVNTLGWPQSMADEFVNKIVDQTINRTQQTQASVAAGSQNNEEVISAPWAEQVKERELTDAQFEAVFGDARKQDIKQILEDYVTTLAKAAEFNRVFGGNKKAGTRGKWNRTQKLDTIMKAAQQQGMTDQEYYEVQVMVDTLMGRVGLDMKPWIRTATSGVILYQNLRVLLFSVFSSFPDMATTVVRSGSFKTVYAAYKKDFANYTNKDSDLWAMARTYGVASDAISRAVLAEYSSSTFLSSWAQNASDKFFKAIGLNAWTNFTRIMGLAVGKQFLNEHAVGALSGNQDSIAKLKELGLKYQDIMTWNASGQMIYGRDGSLEVSPNATGADLANLKAARKVRDALIRFTDESVLRPDASQRPAWASDPRFVLFWHLKSFMYAFHETLNKRVWFEMTKAGPNGPVNLMPLLHASLVFPLAALGLELREVIQYRIGGRKPRSDSLSGFERFIDLTQRSGALGPSQMVADMYGSTQRRSPALIGVAGPTVSHLYELAFKPWSQTGPKSIPVASQIPWLRAKVRPAFKSE